MRELYEEEIEKAVLFYEEGYEDTVEDEELFNTKKSELKGQWDDIFELIEGEYEDAAEQREAERKERDREKKLKELRAQGLNIGGGQKQNQQTAAQRGKREIEGVESTVKGNG